MASVGVSGSQDFSRWLSANGYNFLTRFVGKGVYEGYAVGGQAVWDGDNGQPGYLELDGTQQTIMFKVEGNHRPVMWEFYHTDGTNPSTANYNVSIGYREKGHLMWGGLYAHAVDEVNHLVPFGETYERLSSEYRIQLQGTDGHRVYITPRIQALKQDASRLKDRNP